MYGVLCGKELVAVHDDLDVVEGFVNQQKNQDLAIIKIKKNKIKSIQNNPRYHDIYLVRYGDSYIPYELYESFSQEADQYIYDIRYCIDILNRVLEDTTLTDKESKHVIKTIEIMMNLSDADFNIDISTLRKIDMMNKEYKEKL